MDERVVMAGPLGPSTVFRLLVDGAWSTKEVERLISHLSLMAVYLHADENPELSTETETT